MFFLIYGILSILLVASNTVDATTACFNYSSVGKYDPDWESLDARPLPEWYMDAKVGIFMHFGPYAVPGIVTEWFWKRWNDGNVEIKEFMEANYPPNFTYQDFGSQLKMEFFDPYWWAELVKKSGAKYLVFTTKHHDGFANWPSTYNFGWNSMDIGPMKNVIQELKTAFSEKAPDVHFGLYYSLIEWYFPTFLKDKESFWQDREFPCNKMLPELMEVINTFEPEVLYADGDQQEKDALSDYWGSKDFLAWLYNDSPVKETVAVNDRWGGECRATHGGYWTHTDRYNPGELQEHKFENAMTIDKVSWGYRRNINMSTIMTMDEMVFEIVSTVSCNGNILINVGPTSQGTIAPIFEERLTQIGGWLEKNGEGIYATKPWTHQNDSLSESPHVWYTQSKDETIVYGIVLGWPMNEDNSVTLGDIRTQENTKISLIGYDEPLVYTQNPTSTTVEFPPLQKFLRQCGEEYCQWGYTLKMEHVQSRKE